jgi:hypothetical protein
MKSKESGSKGKPGSKRGITDLAPRGSLDVKGGRQEMQQTLRDKQQRIEDLTTPIKGQPYTQNEMA